MTTSSIIDILNQYGFATIASIGMGWFIYFIYKYVTTEIKKKLGEMSTVLIALIDRVRMLDNDIIRLRKELEDDLEHLHREISRQNDTNSRNLDRRLDNVWAEIHKLDKTINPNKDLVK